MVIIKKEGQPERNINGHKLEAKHTYEEIGEMFADKIEQNCSPTKWKRKVFINWFLPRIKKLGLHFDYRLVHRAFEVWKKLQESADHFTLIVGEEGVGKTTLGIQWTSLISPLMDMDDICYNPDHYLKKLSEVAEDFETHKLENDDRSVLIDEGGIGLFSREAMRSSNRDLNKTFMVQRFLRLNVAICIPHYWSIDTIVRKHRIKTLIYVRSRGNYRCITGKEVNIVNQPNNKGKPLLVIRMPYAVFFDGKFDKYFPLTIDEHKYEQHKLNHIKAFLKDTGGSVENMKQMFSLKEVAAMVGKSRGTIYEYYTQGKIDGVMMCNEIKIPKKEVERLKIEGIKQITWRKDANMHPAPQILKSANSSKQKYKPPQTPSKFPINKGN